MSEMKSSKSSDFDCFVARMLSSVAWSVGGCNPTESLAAFGSVQGVRRARLDRSLEWQCLNFQISSWKGLPDSYPSGSLSGVPLLTEIQ